MSKIWLLFPLGLLITFVCCVLFKVNPLTTIQQFIENPASLIESVGKHIWQIVGMIGTGLTSILYAANQLGKRKQEFDQVTSGLKATFAEEKTKLETKLSEQKESYEGQLKEWKDKAGSAVELEKQNVKLEATVTAQQRTIDELHFALKNVPEEYRLKLEEKKKVP